MFNFFNKKKLLLAFEYGVTISETAKEMNIELTPEIMEKAEIMIVNEFKKGNPTRIAVDMVPNILSIFELDLSK
jgi:hypothetical protein